MQTIDILAKAIKEQRKVKFDYRKEGFRIGDPYAIYKNSNINNELLDLYQTDGYSSTNEKIPGWRQFIIENISKIEILDDKFEINNLYNSNSERYNNSIVKI